MSHSLKTTATNTGTKTANTVTKNVMVPTTEQSYLYPSPLINRSVSCWLNSIIQSLCTSPIFCSTIKKNVKKHAYNDVYRGFYSFIVKNEMGYNTEECSSNILEALNKLNRDSMYSVKIVYGQQCALEFFENVLEALKDPEIVALFRCAYLRETTCPHCHVQNKVINAHRYVPLFKNSRVPTLHDPVKYPFAKKFVLDLIGTSEILDCWKCPKCLAETKDIRSDYRIVLMPKIFVLQFDKAIDNGPVILVDKFVLNLRGTNNQTVYKALATINHYGTATSGHYLANCIRRVPGTDQISWYCCNDQSVQKLSYAPLESTDIYMAFYSCE